MRIGGYVKQSLLDWDGVLAAVVFTKGCNFRCGYCHNPSLVIPALCNRSPDIDEGEVLAYLSRRRGWLEGVVITGGEPTLQPDLTDFIHRVRALGFRVRLDTNGTQPDLLAALIADGLVDAVAMDVKSIPDVEHYARVTPGITPTQVQAVQRSVELLRRSGIEYQLRTTLIPGIHTQHIKNLLDASFSGDPYVCHAFRDPGRDGVVADHTDIAPINLSNSP